MIPAPPNTYSIDERQIIGWDEHGNAVKVREDFFTETMCPCSGSAKVEGVNVISWVLRTYAVDHHISLFAICEDGVERQVP